MSKTETMHEATARLGVTVEIKRDLGHVVDDGWEHHAYVLTVTFGRTGATLETPWGQGLGIETSPADEPAMILDSLVRDATDETFEDWCEEYGYDVDSRKAHKTWTACREGRERLVEILGADEVDHLRHEVDGL